MRHCDRPDLSKPSAHDAAPLPPPRRGLVSIVAGLLALQLVGCGQTDEVDAPNLIVGALQQADPPGVGIPLMTQVRAGRALRIDTRLGRHIGPRDPAPTRTSCLHFARNSNDRHFQFLVIPDDQQAVVHVTLYADSNNDNPCEGAVLENAFIQVSARPENRLTDTLEPAGDTALEPSDVRDATNDAD